MGSDNQRRSYWNVCVGQADCRPLRIEIQVRAIPKLRRAKQFIRAKAAEWMRSILWLDRRATSPPIQEFGSTIVFNAAFDGEQSVGSAVGQRHLDLPISKMGCMRRRNSDAGNQPLVHALTGWLRCVFAHLEFRTMDDRRNQMAVLAGQSVCRSLSFVAFWRSASGLRLDEGPPGGCGEAKDPAASRRLCRLTAQVGEAPKVMAACNWKRSESGEMELRKALPLDLGARTKCAHAPQEWNPDRSK